MENPPLSKVNTIKILDFPLLSLVYRTLSPISRIFLQFPPLTAPLGRHHPSVLPYPKPPFPIPKLSLLPSLSRRYAKAAPKVFQLVIKHHWRQSKLGKTCYPTRYHLVPPLGSPTDCIISWNFSVCTLTYLPSPVWTFKTRFRSKLLQHSKPKRVTHMTCIIYAYIIYHICIYTHHGIFNLIFRQAWT